MYWGSVFLLLLAASLLGLYAYLFSPDWLKTAGLMPVALHSPLRADYSADLRGMRPISSQPGAYRRCGPRPVRAGKRPAARIDRPAADSSPDLDFLPGSNSDQAAGRTSHRHARRAGGDPASCILLHPALDAHGDKAEHSLCDAYRDPFHDQYAASGDRHAEPHPHQGSPHPTPTSTKAPPTDTPVTPTSTRTPLPTPTNLPPTGYPPPDTPEPTGYPFP